MARRFKYERNKQIVDLKDKKNWSFSQIGDEYGLAKQTVHSIYRRTKIKAEQGVTKARQQ